MKVGSVGSVGMVSSAGRDGTALGMGSWCCGAATEGATPLEMWEMFIKNEPSRDSARFRVLHIVPWSARYRHLVKDNE